MPEKLTIFCDGAVQGNPGRAAVGVVIIDSDGCILREISEALPDAMTNNEAEYRAVIKALIAARDLCGVHIRIHSDSQLIVRQIAGQYDCTAANLVTLRDRARRCLAHFPDAQLVWVPREQNAHADALAGKALHSSSLSASSLPMMGLAGMLEWMLAQGWLFDIGYKLTSQQWLVLLWHVGSRTLPLNERVKGIGPTLEEAVRQCLHEGKQMVLGRGYVLATLHEGHVLEELLHA